MRKAPGRRQGGYFYISNTALAVLGAIIGLCGWASVEGVRWLASHLSLSWIG